MPERGPAEFDVAPLEAEIRALGLEVQHVENARRLKVYGPIPGWIANQAHRSRTAACAVTAVYPVALIGAVMVASAGVAWPLVLALIPLMFAIVAFLDRGGWYMREADRAAIRARAARIARAVEAADTASLKLTPEALATIAGVVWRCSNTGCAVFEERVACELLAVLARVGGAESEGAVEHAMLAGRATEGAQYLERHAARALAAIHERMSARSEAEQLLRPSGEGIETLLRPAASAAGANDAYVLVRPAASSDDSELPLQASGRGG